MRTSGGNGLPSSRWPKALSRVAACFAALFLPQAAIAATAGIALDARMLLLLGITLGVIAFAIGTAIICLHTTQRARKAEAEAANEAERYRLSGSMLDTVLTAEPQMLLTVSETGEADLLVSTLPANYGVLHEAARVLNFVGGLDAASGNELDGSVDVHVD